MRDIIAAMSVIEDPVTSQSQMKKRKVRGTSYEALAAGALFPKPWLFEPAKRPDDRADYLDCSFLPQWKHRVLVFTLE